MMILLWLDIINKTSSDLIAIWLWMIVFFVWGNSISVSENSSRMSYIDGNERFVKRLDLYIVKQH